MLESLPFPSPKLTSIDNAWSQKSDVVVIGLADDGQWSSAGSELDKAGGGFLSKMAARGALLSKRGSMSKLALPDESVPDAGAAFRYVLVVGVGDKDALNRVDGFELVSTVVRQCADQPSDSITISLAEFFPEEDHDVLVAGAIFACEGQGIYQSDPKLFVPTGIAFTAIADAHRRRGESIGKAVNLTRRLVNEPAGVIYPESFVQRVEQTLEATSLQVEAWDEHRLESEGCRAIMAVGQGSSRKPRLLMIRHLGGSKGEAPVAIVGKGVTFDSGGLSIKPSEGMVDMKCDMAGAATVVGVMQAIAESGVKRNVIGFCGLAENMVSGDSYKLGDVIETRSGKTIEILNTDAEGRVVLADTLDVAIQFQPSAMVDLATLTGACMVALGNEVAGLMTNDQSLCDAVRAAADVEGEPVWQLPMFELYDDKVKSKVADIKNVGEGRWGGAITAAKFLEQFVGETPWVHIDIAGPAFTDGAKPHRDAGATGVMVRSLLRWIDSMESTSG